MSNPRGRCPVCACPACGRYATVVHSDRTRYGELPARRRRVQCRHCGHRTVTWEFDQADVDRLTGLQHAAPTTRDEQAERHAEMVAAWRGGVSFPEIAAAMGVTRQAVGQAVRAWLRREREAAG